MKFIRILFSILMIFISSLFSDNNKWEYKSDILELKKHNGDNIKELKGNVYIDHGNVDLYTDYAQVNDSKNLIKLKGRIQVIDSTKTIICDEMIYYRDKNKHAIAWGNVSMREDDRTIICDSLYYWKTDGYREMSFNAIGDVNITGKDEFIFAESVSYDDDVQTMDLFDSARIEKGSRKIQGDSLYIQFNDSLINRVSVVGNAYAFNDVRAKIFENSSLYKFMDVMSSKQMVTDFEGQDVTKVKMEGMASALYNVVEDTLLKGYNDVSGDIVLLSFDNDILNRMEVFGGCRGSFVPEGDNSSIDSTVVYRADAIDYRIDEELSHFYRNSNIDYKETNLKADYVQVDWKSNILKAEGDAFTKPSVTTGDSNDPMVGDTLYYNLSTEKGKIIKGKTKVNDSYYHGENIYSGGDKNIYSSDAMYTSCDLDHPHFYLQSKNMKIRKGEDVIARPVTLIIYDLPIMFFPFAVLPNTGGDRRRGWIMPSLNYLESKGTYLEHLGYYIPFDQYADYRILVDIWDRDRILVKNKLRYDKRDVYSGSISSTIDNTLHGTDDISQMFNNYNKTVWDFKLQHYWNLDPSSSQSLNLDYTYVSVNNFYQQQNMGFNPEDQTQLVQTLSSYIRYHKDIGSNNSLSILVTEYYNLLAENETPSFYEPTYHKIQKLPKIVYNQRVKPIFGSGDKWYNDIMFSLNSKVTLQKQIGRLFDINEDEIRDTTKVDNGTVHDMVISIKPPNLFGWLGITPYMSLQETWIYGYEPTEVVTGTSSNDDGTIVNEISIENIFNHNSSTFRRRMTGNANISFYTDIYGVFPGTIFKLKAIRHTMSPSITYTYAPSFREYDEYDYFSGMAINDIRATSFYGSQKYTFSLKNTFQAKKESNGLATTIHLFTYNIDTKVFKNTNLEEWKWDIITSRFGTSLYGSNLNVNLTHDLYDENDKWNNTPRLISAYASLNFSLSGESVNDNSTQSSDVLNTNQNQFGSDYQQGTFYTSPWYATIDFNYSLDKKLDGWENKFSMYSKVLLKLTKNWSLTYDIGYNITDGYKTANMLGLERQLHCWLFSFDWNPGIGPDKTNQGFRIHIRVKDPNLEDIRIRQSGGAYKGVY